MRQKVIAQTTILGQQGVNLVERLVMDMGCIWSPTGSVEAGIDGFIELRDKVTEQVLNAQIAVQVKAVSRDFANETDEGFDFYCSGRDIEYWLKGNLPVLLIVARPGTGEAYWVSIKDYFQHPSNRQSTKVHFTKASDRFEVSSVTRLFAIAVPSDAGVYLASPPKTETLFSNLLPVAFLPSRVYLADTQFRHYGEIWQEVRSQGLEVGGEWILRNGRILSFNDITRSEWRTLCDQGTVEDFGTEEWSLADDHNRQREFVDLVRRTLESMVRPDVILDRKRGMFYFRATPALEPRTISYRSLSRTADREVFGPHRNKSGAISYYRHSAFLDRFRRVDDHWYLEVTPTYHFTRDGVKPSRYADSLLSGIKKIEGHEAVRGQVIMWGSYLTPRADLLSHEPYPYLGFWDLLTLHAERGIPDSEWETNRSSAKLQESEAPTQSSGASQGTLFS